ncbi:phosphonate C-P lyase system protein PhnG [Nocardia alni]|uniref:phosphonate C-P lyase system protein PhnG n=1 Tax=Nocardia alni TaxID=2815723 RepID=UPI001C2504D9|nr:phosphonate C-P lyase system protein PhnG [Nocardia alni]
MSENTVPEQIPLSRERRTELLAYAEPAELIELADTCLSIDPDPVVIVAPELGTITAQVREPIVGQRFLLGDVLVCRAEVEWSGYRGWAMRTDEDRPAVLAAAILDAAAQSDATRAEQVDALCVRVAERIRDDEAAEWAELEPTIVRFEELR